MNFNELSKLVYKKYGLKFEPALPGSQELFLLKSPVDGSTFAMMSRIKRSGHFIATLDVRCGDFSEIIRDLPGFSTPFRLKSNEWIGIWLKQVKEEAVESTLDYAFKLAMNPGKKVIDKQPFIYIPGEEDNQKYQAQVIKPRKNGKIIANHEEFIPSAIKKMMASYDYSLFPSKGRAKNFVHQGRMIADFNDNYNEEVYFKRFYPTFHDMNVKQLRTYFTWRSKIRKNIYEKTYRSYAYVYLYEILNNIGVENSQDGFNKLKEFNDNYVQKFDQEISNYLNKWMQDYVIYYDLTNEKEFCFKKEIAEDHFGEVLLKPENFAQNEVLAAFLKFSTYLANNVTRKKLKNEFGKILYQVWLTVSKVKLQNKIDFFHKYIAKQNLYSVDLFSNAVFYYQRRSGLKYVVDEKRKYFYKNNHTYCSSLIGLKRQKSDLNTFLHEVDRLIRIKLHLGKEIKPRKLDEPFLKAISRGIDEYLARKREAERPKIEINFAYLDQIRADASKTRDSLLTEEEIELEQKERTTQNESADNESKQNVNESLPIKNNEYGLSKDETYFLLALLQKRSWKEYIKDHHLMPSILADGINDKLFDEIGDAVIEFNDNNEPEIVADYYPDLKEMFLGGEN